MKPKVAIYGAGQYGLEAMRIMHQKGWEIVAAYNRAGEKVGRDAGELAGIEPLDVPVQDCKTADYASSGANIAIHSVADRLDYNWVGHQRLLSAGINVICHGGESYFPWGSRPELAGRLDELAKANGVTFTGTGIWDYSRIWSGLLAAGSASELSGLVHRTLTNGEVTRGGDEEIKQQIQKSRPSGRPFFYVWRWARDSNPGNLSVQRFSRPPLSTTQPAHLNCLPGRLPAESAHYIAALVLIKTPPQIPLFAVLEDHCWRAAHHAQSLSPAVPRFARTIGLAL